METHLSDSNDSKQLQQQFYSTDEVILRLKYHTGFIDDKYIDRFKHWRDYENNITSIQLEKYGREFILSYFCEDCDDPHPVADGWIDFVYPRDKEDIEYLTNLFITHGAVLIDV